MRHALLSTAGWAGLLQAAGAATPFTETWLRLMGAAGVLGTLTVLVYRLGVWRQEMEHTKENVLGEMKAYRDDNAAAFERIEQRLTAIDHLFTEATEQWHRVERRQTRVEKRLDRIERLDLGRADRAP
jgi:hypothetical protein